MRMCAAGAVGIVLLASAGLSAQHAERVEVRRVIVDVRAFDVRGGALSGLTARDFHVTIDGRPARIESATWLSSQGAATPVTVGTDTTSGPTPTTVSRGRVIVFLFQKDLDESRVVGLKTVLDGCRALVMRLGPDDRAAILSFDSHLKLWVDLTADKPALLRAIDREILFGDAPPIVAGPPPSLGAGLDPIRARDASTLEQALALTAKALAPIAGAKSLVFAGWGFGRLVINRVQFDDEYQAACRSLQTARVAVFSLDVTQAEYHSLEAGLRSVADATGGFYAKADPSPSVALARLNRALAGHYELLVEPPDSLRRGEHVIKVLLTRVRGRLLSRPSYTD